MLESVSSSRTPSHVQLAIWSPKMDVIALVFQSSPDAIEFRRMDWTKVNSITLDAPVSAFCFSPDGKNLCVATTTNKILLYEIEHCHLLSSRTSESEVLCVHMGESNGLILTIVGCADGTISVFCNFHFALSTFILPMPARELSFSGTSIYALHEDCVEVSHFQIPSITSQSLLVGSMSKALSEYWISYQKIESARVQLEEKWKRIWDEAAVFTPHIEELTKAFLLGKDPPEIMKRTHRMRIQKDIAQGLKDMRELIANTIVPHFTKLDASCEQLKAGVDIFPNIGITIEGCRSPTQIKNCILNMKNLQTMELCFETLFSYIEDSRAYSLSVSATEFADFLVNYLTYFPLLDFEIQTVPISTPMFDAIEVGGVQLPGRFTMVRGSMWTCIGDKVKILDVETEELQEFEVEGTILMAYLFEDGSVGCFYEADEKVMFVMINGDEERVPHEVELSDAMVFIVSPRRIALVQSAQLFCSVVDLESGEDQEEEEEVCD